MSKTFKTSLIFSFSALWLVLMRILFNNINIGDYLNGWLFSFSVQVIGMGVFPLCMYRYYVKGDPFTDFGFKKKVSPIVWLATIGIGVVMSFLLPTISAIWQTILQLIGYKMTNAPGTVYPENGGFGILVMELVTTAVFPGIFEEINYRGLSMQMFSNVEDDRRKIVYIGILFGLGHQFIGQTGYAFIAGLILAYLFVKTGSILPGMIVHFMNNAISVVSEYSYQTTGAFYNFRNGILQTFFQNFLLLALFLVGLSFIMILLLRLVKKITQSTTEEPEVSRDSDEYYYPQKTRYVDDLFGDLHRVRVVKTVKRSAWYEYAPLMGTAALMLITTVFTFVWGMWR